MLGIVTRQARSRGISSILAQVKINCRIVSAVPLNLNINLDFSLIGTCIVMRVVNMFFMHEQNPRIEITILIANADDTNDMKNDDTNYGGLLKFHSSFKIMNFQS